MLEGIRCYLMKRMATRRQKISKWENNICPNIIDKVEKYKKRCGECNPIWCGEGYYQVHCPAPEQYSLNLDAKTCSCRKWDLKGIPCTHAITAIAHSGRNIEDFIDSCYRKETNASIYKGIIYPINGRNMWPASGCIPILPPNYGRSIGRPRKSRRKEKGEVENPNPEKLKRQNGSLRCGNCGQWGHNMRSCKNEANPAVRRRPTGGLVFSRPRGRPRAGGPQSSYGRGRGSDASQVTEVNQPFTGTNDIPTQASQVMGNNSGMGTGSDGATRGGRGSDGGTRGGRGRGGGNRGGRGRGQSAATNSNIHNDSSVGPASQTNKSSDPAAQLVPQTKKSSGPYTGIWRGKAVRTIGLQRPPWS
ncbi:hypothetical protein Vadar_015299 [Vaccinium darrowii]|uniref:Uncharacterized protein n=1 Tax=Vaccinium darrowii TaxID=229202 RepID=A0ACB7ZCS7_9ERIC|nr:hypothetical protein Vadar_015299 [Vaccinium darrowii]